MDSKSKDCMLFHKIALDLDPISIKMNYPHIEVLGNFAAKIGQALD